MTQAAVLWTAVGSAALVAVFAGMADRRQKNRRDLDQVGIVPWTILQVIAVAVAISCLAYALRVK